MAVPMIVRVFRLGQRDQILERLRDAVGIIDRHGVENDFVSSAGAAEVEIVFADTEHPDGYLIVAAHPRTLQPTREPWPHDLELMDSVDMILQEFDPLPNPSSNDGTKST